MRIIDLNLRNKIILLGAVAAFVPALTSAFLVHWKEHRVNLQMQEAINGYSSRLIDRSADDAYSTVEIANEMIQKNVDQSLNVARAYLAEAGAVSLSQPGVQWNILNQFSLKASDVTLPRFLVGSTWIKPNTDFKTPSPIVDKVTEITHAQCTIFQRINDAGDMLRVCTTVPNQDGLRAVGTYIPAIGVDGKPDPVISTVLSGQTFRGRSFVVNAWYMSNYEPIRNSRGEVVGMLFVGVSRDAVPKMHEILMRTEVSKTGEILVLYASNEGVGSARNLKGECVISKDRKYNGRNFLDERDADGRAYVQDILTEAVKLQPTFNGAMTVKLRDPGTDQVHNELIQYQYFKPWDWVIVARAPESDFDEARIKVHREIQSLLWYSAGGGILGILLAGWLAAFTARRIATPIARVTEIAGDIARGNLLEAGKLAGAETCSVSSTKHDGEISEDMAKRQDETGRLFCATRTMINNLYSLISQVKTASIQLVSTATQISATSKQQETTVQNFGTSTSEIAAAVKEISATSQELLKTMDDVTVVASDTGSQASAAHVSIGGMEEAMRRLAQSTTSISSKLSVINEKATNIGSVITTITKVADQTNLLSLNAAIEAEKAGEYGLGFSVVAREIRRLADQTAVATLDIEQMIREMQSSVSTGVMEMDKFSEEVRRNVQETSKLGKDFSKIIDQVQALTPRFEAVHEGMQAQSQGAQQINDAMLQLTEAARQSAVSIREFNLAAEQLHRAVQGLKEEVGKFKVS